MSLYTFVSKRQHIENSNWFTNPKVGRWDSSESHWPISFSQW